MSNAIIKTDAAERFEILKPESEIRDAIIANFAGENELGIGDLTIAKTPSGGLTKWTFNTVDGDETTDAIEGIMVLYHPFGTLWGDPESQDGSRPCMVTSDLKVGHLVYGEDGSVDWGDIDPDELDQFKLYDADEKFIGYDWKKLPQNQWGTGKGGNGKRCQEQRYVGILRAGESLPILIRVQPGSLKSVTKFILKLPVPHYRCVVSVGLKKSVSTGGKAFSEIEITRTGTLTKDQGDIVKSLFTEPLKSLVCRMAERGDRHNSGQDDLE